MRLLTTRRRIFVSTAAMSVLILGTGSSVAVGPGTTGRWGAPTDVAGVSPYMGSHCNVATPYYTQPGGKEAEPTIAVDPRQPNHRIVAWMDATRATVDVKYTRDGGRTWNRTVPQGIDQCTGDNSNEWEASGDVWASFGPDGTAYISTLTWAHFVTPPAEQYVSVVHVQSSTDGGRTWSDPVFLAGHDAVSDKPMVLADPNHAGVAYEIWRNQSFGMPVGGRGATQLLFARTDDGGHTWTEPVLITPGADTDFFGTPLISVLRNGTLVATTSLTGSDGVTRLLSYRSTDHGATWSGPVVISAMSDGDLAPICDQVTAGADGRSASGQQTVVRGRTVVLVNVDGAAAGAGHGAIVESSSNDGGRSWHSRTIVRSNDPVMLASIAATHGGRLGLVWDEVAADDADCVTSTVPARTRFAASHGASGRWSRPVTVGAAWWNLADGARGTGGFSGYFIGDYQSLTAVGGRFTTATVQGGSLDGHSPSVTGDTGVVVAVPRG